jgi:hypothetical protein
VDWLIKNIESNGKLAQELVEKISQSETTATIGSVSNQKKRKKAEINKIFIKILFKAPFF